MMDAVILVGLGAALGLVVGFMLGVESPRRCESCRANTGSRYNAGFETGVRIGRKDGYCGGVEDTVELVKERGETTVQAWDGREVWNIRKDKLEKIREDLTEAAYV